MDSILVKLDPYESRDRVLAELYVGPIKGKGGSAWDVDSARIAQKKGAFRLANMLYERAGEFFVLALVEELQTRLAIGQDLALVREAEAGGE